jgi:hypothetical protein
MHHGSHLRDAITASDVRRLFRISERHTININATGALLPLRSFSPVPGVFLGRDSFLATQPLIIANNELGCPGAIRPRCYPATELGRSLRCDARQSHGALSTKLRECNIKATLATAEWAGCDGRACRSPPGTCRGTSSLLVTEGVAGTIGTLEAYIYRPFPCFSLPLSGTKLKQQLKARHIHSPCPLLPVDLPFAVRRSSSAPWL